MKTLIKILLSFILAGLFLLGFTSPLNPPNGFWYQQFIPNLNGRVITDIEFTDSLTGYAITSRDSSNITSVLKTINGGNNWNVIFTNNDISFIKLAFINSNTGFIARGFSGTTGLVYKTTNGGINWSILNLPVDGFANDISVLSENLIWVANPAPLYGGLFRTTNGGASWENVYGGSGNNPEKIYMYNARIGFMSRGTSPFNKTTDGGYNWAVLNGGTWRDIYFIDSLTGWKCNVIAWPNYDMKKTTDGGINWSAQILPTGGIINSSAMARFSVLNKDTIWGTGGYVYYGNNRYRGILYRTTNGGNNWLFQIPDTSYGIGAYYNIQFLNHQTGWAFGNVTNNIFRNIHTTNRGDTNFLVGISQISIEVPIEYVLFQNYPNPFNPITNIKYQITNQLKRQTSNVKIIIYDIIGREIIKLVNEEQKAGTYQVDFSGCGYSSGIYFYSLIIDNRVIDTKKMILVK